MVYNDLLFSVFEDYLDHRYQNLLTRQSFLYRPSCTISFFIDPEFPSSVAEAKALINQSFCTLRHRTEFSSNIYLYINNSQKGFAVAGTCCNKNAFSRPRIRKPRFSVLTLMKENVLKFLARFSIDVSITCVFFPIHNNLRYLH